MFIDATWLLDYSIIAYEQGIYLLAWMGWNADIEGRGLGCYKRKNRTEDLNLCALSATITMMETVHPSAPTARKSDCPVLKNQGTEARGMVYALGGETNQDLDNTEDDINA
ncbi:hypothetical protein Tco_0876031 [Tanacetum coccineum]|uniref:Uncharacterized protein n=1 Tax=Tanacetum coccineum TaxID=301880 RepID=A0ABQ5BR60_9ASTR